MGTGTGALYAVLLNCCTKSRFYPNLFFRFLNCYYVIRMFYMNHLFFAFVIIAFIVIFALILRVIELEQELAANLAVKNRTSKELAAAKQELATVHIRFDTLKKNTLKKMLGKVTQWGQKLQKAQRMTQKKHDESLADLRAKLDEKERTNEFLITEFQKQLNATKQEHTTVHIRADTLE